MHYRLSRDAAFGLGSIHPGDDMLGVIPFENPNGPQAKRAASKATAVHSSAALAVSAAVMPEQHHPHPKRVSFTSDERALPISPPASDSEEEQEKAKEAAAPLQVAEILRQMSQGPTILPAPPVATPLQVAAQRSLIPISAGKKGLRKSPGHGETMGPEERKHALELLAKKKIPTAFLHTPKVTTTKRRNSKTEPEPAAKRVRWLPNTTHPYTARALHGMVAAPAPITIPTFKPLPNLQPYDVVLGEEYVSHFNLGNRRLLVLAYPYLLKKEGVNAATSLYEAITNGGGRFVKMGNNDVFDNVDKTAALNAIDEILAKLASHSDKQLIQLFHRDCASVWRSEKKPAATEVSDSKPAAKQVLASKPIPDREAAAIIAKIPDNVARSPKRPSPKKNSLPKRPSTIEPMTPLALDFEPGPFDVICCRGKQPKEHPGNQYFASLVEQNCARYVEAKGKMGKSLILTEILDTIRRKSPNGGFVKKNEDGRWCETGDHLAREKISQCFRDRLHTRYSSSSKAKLERRRSSKSSLEETLTADVRAQLKMLAEAAEASEDASDSDSDQ